MTSQPVTSSIRASFGGRAGSGPCVCVCAPVCLWLHDPSEAPRSKKPKVGAAPPSVSVDRPLCLFIVALRRLYLQPVVLLSQVSQTVAHSSSKLPPPPLPFPSLPSSCPLMPSLSTGQVRKGWREKEEDPQDRETPCLEPGVTLDVTRQTQTEEGLLVTRS